MSDRRKLQDEVISLAHGNGGRFMRDPTCGSIAIPAHLLSRAVRERFSMKTSKTPRTSENS